jgi:hypothetical protein
LEAEPKLKAIRAAARVLAKARIRIRYQVQKAG